MSLLGVLSLTLAVVDDQSGDVGVGGDIGGFQQVFVNGACAFAGERAVGHRGADDFGFKQYSEQGRGSLGSVKKRLKGHSRPCRFFRCVDI